MASCRFCRFIIFLGRCTCGFGYIQGVFHSLRVFSNLMRQLHLLEADARHYEGLDAALHLLCRCKALQRRHASEESVVRILHIAPTRPMQGVTLFVSAYVAPIMSRCKALWHLPCNNSCCTYYADARHCVSSVKIESLHLLSQCKALWHLRCTIRQSSGCTYYEPVQGIFIEWFALWTL